MKKLFLTIAFLLPIIAFAQAPSKKSNYKSTVKNSVNKIAAPKPVTNDSIQLVLAAKDTTAPKPAVKKTAKPVDSLAKKTAAKNSKPTDSLVKKTAVKKSAKPVDSLTKKAPTKKSLPVDSLAKKSADKKTAKQVDSLVKKAPSKKSKSVDSLTKKSTDKKSIKPSDTTQKVKVVKGWFEISGVDSTDLKETLLKKNAVEWFTNWFTTLSDRYPTFKASVADSLNQTEGYFRGHGSNEMEDNYNQNSISKMTMSYKTEVRVKGKTYQYRFYDFKIKSTLVQNGKLVIDETITNIDEEKEKYRNSKDPFKGWRLKKIQNEVQLILDSFQNILMQTPQRLNAFE